MRTIYIVERHWYEEYEIVAAFESDADAQQFAKQEQRRSRWHHSIHSTELHAALTPDKANPQPAVAAGDSDTEEAARSSEGER